MCALWLNCQFHKIGYIIVYNIFITLNGFSDIFAKCFPIPNNLNNISKLFFHDICFHYMSISKRNIFFDDNEVLNFTWHNLIQNFASLHKMNKNYFHFLLIFTFSSLIICCIFSSYAGFLVSISIDSSLGILNYAFRIFDTID